MERNPYIKESNLKKKEHYPVYVFFNIISTSGNEFLEVCENFSNGIGMGINYAICLFPEDIDIISERFNGVEFSTHFGDEIVVDYSTFYYYLDIACEHYLDEHPADRKKIVKLLNKVKQRFNC